MKKQSILLWIVIFILLIGIGALGYVWWQDTSVNKQAEAEQSADASEKEVQKEILPGTLMDCDTVSGFTVKSQNGDVTVSVEPDAYKEGAGAYMCRGRNTVWWEVVAEQSTDISAYKDGGVHCWFYIDDPTQLTTNITVEIGNAEDDSVAKAQWTLRKEKLTEGWNDCVLKFINAIELQQVDLTKINYFRMYGALRGEVTVMIDDVRAVETDSQKVIMWTCDNASGLTLDCSQNQYQFTSKEDAFKEGDGAIKVVGDATHRCSAVFSQPIDISACEEGVLHVWLYIDDVSKIAQAVAVEIGSAGMYDRSEYQWSVDKEELVNGWNELTLPLLQASESQDAGINLSQVNWFRVYTSAEGNRTVILDDIYVTN